MFEKESLASTHAKIKDGSAAAFDPNFERVYFL